ncbi:MAG TPA: NAD(P)/FAD-dependent oxidoreductase [Actinomycetes bacterium]|nr:NAD(P)/FAD-dependent oxidoreductase [Actinomycetes bacterium]
MTRKRVLVLGGGFGGMYTAHRLERRLPAEETEIVLINAENYLLYTPLLPEAAAGTIEPRHVVVPLRQALRRTRVKVGTVTAVDLGRRTCTYVDAGGTERALGWDRLVIALGSVSRMFPIPGLAEHAHGFKTLAEAIFLRNHALEQLELAEVTDDPDERRARLTFVVVGAGYAGTEVVAELQALVRRALRLYPALRMSHTRWVLADVAPQVLPELGGRLSRTALEVLRKRGVEIRLRTTLDQVGPDWVRFSDGEWVPTSTVVWTAGVTPDPLIGKLGLETDERGRLVVDEYLAVSGRDEVFALGDVAAVPIAGRKGATAPPTAQHALRQARVCGDNIAASLGHGERRPFAFKGLGLLVNLSEGYGVGRVLGVPVSGVVGWFVTRSYHWFSLPTWTRRLRVGLDWAVAAVFPRDVAELGTLGHPEPLPGDELPPR